MINTRSPRKLIHTQIILSVVKHHLVQIQKNGTTDYLSCILAAVEQTLGRKRSQKKSMSGSVPSAANVLHVRSCFWVRYFRSGERNSLF